jgi:outer membrane protein TolC
MIPIRECAAGLSRPHREANVILSRTTGRAAAAFFALSIVVMPSRAQATGSESNRPPVSLTLRQAVDMAMQHNRRLRLAQLSVADNKAKESIAKSNYYPHISNQSTALYFTELQGVTIPRGALGNPTTTGPLPGTNITVGQGALDAFTSGTGVAQPLTQFFKIHAGNQAATADLRGAQFDEQDAENSISLLVHQLYFEILMQQAHLEAAEQSVAAAQLVERESTRSVSEGRSLEVVALQAHAAMLDQKQAVLTQQLTIDDSMLQLDDAVGLPLGTQILLDPGSAGDSPLIPSRGEALAAVVARNPKVLSAQQTVEKAKAGVAAARDAYIPDITGLARYSYQSGVPLLVHNFGSFGGAVTFDIFDGGAREGKLKQAKIQLQMAETQLQQTEADVRIQVSAAYDKVERLEQLVSVVQEALKSRTEAARVSKEQVAHTALLESAAAKDTAAIFDTNASLLEARLGLYLARNNIQQMLGERP